MSEIFYPISFPTPINTNIAVSESFIGKTYAEMYTANGCLLYTSDAADER